MKATTIKWLVIICEKASGGLSIKVENNIEKAGVWAIQGCKI